MFELEVVKFFAGLGQGTIVDTLSYWISWRPLLFILLVAVCAAIIKYDKKNGKKVVLVIVISLCLFYFFNDIVIKGFAADYFGMRERPYEVYQGIINPIGEQLTDSSFPSGHMASLLAATTVIIYYYRKWWLTGTIVALVMAFSRMHNGMHYLSDVLAGAAFGIAYGAAAILIADYIFEKKRKK